MLYTEDSKHDTSSRLFGGRLRSLRILFSGKRERVKRVPMCQPFETEEFIASMRALNRMETLHI
jgi:hypothetical protein